MIPFRCNSRNMRTTALLTLFLLFATTARSELLVASFVRFWTSHEWTPIDTNAAN